jgi:hypothetical protein
LPVVRTARIQLVRVQGGVPRKNPSSGRLYLRRIGYSAGGREIKVLKKDDEAKPDLALTQLRNLIEGDGVDFVVGPISSAVALAIRNYVHEQGTPRSWNSVSG